MDAKDTVMQLRMTAGLNRGQLARLSGVAASTISRIELGTLEPTWATMNKVLMCAGYKTTGALDSAGDRDAVHAARFALGELTNTVLTDGALEWLRRWERAGFTRGNQAVSVKPLALAAGIASGIFERPNRRISVVYDVPWQKLAAALSQAGFSYAVTGITATEPTRATDGAWWPLIYLDRLSAAVAELNLSPAPHGQPRITLFEFDDVSRAETVTSDGFTWASPAQALIDSYGGPGRMADQADAVSERWQRSLVAA